MIRAARPRPLALVLRSKHGPQTDDELRMATSHIEARLAMVRAGWSADDEHKRRFRQGKRGRAAEPTPRTTSRGVFGTL